MVRYLAGLKNVSLNPKQADVATDWANKCLAGMGPIVGHEDELRVSPLITRFIDIILNMMAAMQVMQLVEELVEGKVSPDPRVTLERGQAEVDRFTGGAALYRWPDIEEMFTRHYGDLPWAPIVATDESGTTTTYYMRNWKLHRDPAEGRALHRKNRHGELSEYWVDGVRHRPHAQGPALINENFEGDNVRSLQFFENGIVHRPSSEGPAILCTCKETTLLEVYIENDRAHRDPRQGPAILERVFGMQNYTTIEYRENGTLNRPSEDGPALQWIDERGKVIREVFEERGIRHRNPMEGPAFWALENGHEEFEYMVQDKLHRDEAEGPAKFTRDAATGIVVREEYRRNGVLHRSNGPASMARDTAGRVTLEGWLRDGLMHRDEQDGPALVERDSETGVFVLEFYYQHGELHRRKGPSRIERDRTTGIVSMEEYHLEGRLHREEDQGPAYFLRDTEAGVVLLECYYRDGEMHRLSGPASISRGATGQIIGECWYLNGRSHREDGPCDIYRDNDGNIVNESYYVEGRPHRLDGPAILGHNKAGRITEACWYVDGKLHRDPKDGPAEFRLKPTEHNTYRKTTDEHGETRDELVERQLEWTEASQTEFYLNGERHREPADGPAVIEQDAAGDILREEYWVGGKQVAAPPRLTKPPRLSSQKTRKRGKKPSQ
ncbi:hypothetical protein [Bradyrhizobium acaciae]|uniref:hypothetical protein n=1 Tax=Bradyrhizobium acaciae TaxID=2683706 RepID=UPI001E2C7F18|nr:hypothetical protein [Bradyrhizobium acaciae]MCC8978899.1 hypothetical protein [Bradyrhizobium acaciae]